MSKKLVAYFSASGTTKTSAEKIAKLLNCDTYEIKPKKKYETKDLDWNDPNSRTTIECKDRNCRPELADKNAILPIMIPFLLDSQSGGMLLQILFLLSWNLMISLEKK